MNPNITPHWILSRRLRRSFTYAAYITIFGLLAGFVETILSMTVLRDFETMKISMAAFILFFVAVTILLAAGFYLWVGMMFFLFKVDRRSLFSKCLLLPFFIIGNTLTATLYYFFVYREIGRRLDQPSPAL